LGKNLKLLEELQAIDLKLDSWRGEKEALLTEMVALERKLEDVLAAIAEKNAELTAIDEEKLGLDETLAAETENITKSEARLRDIKTQKEYQAVSKEIASAKKIKAEMEEQLLQRIALADEIKASVTEMEENSKVMATQVTAQKSAILEKIERLEAGIDADIVTRQSAIKNIPASVVNRYTMLREKRQGLAVVEARNGSCLGCNMNLPPQVYNNLFKADNLITCPHCQRLLFLRQEEDTIGK
jgi:predicted  nucleic acid-binding Zn-ribbon protein